MTRRARKPKIDIAAEIQKLGDPDLPDTVVDARPAPSGILLGPEVEEVRSESSRDYTMGNPEYRAYAVPNRPEGLEYNEIPRGERNDRRCQDIFDFAQRALQRKTIDARVQEVLDKKMFPPEDISIKDVAYTLARYGGRIEVKNFGTFYVKERPGYWRWTPYKKTQYFVPARRIVEFFPSEELKALTNEDFYSETIQFPTPNSDFFEKRMQLILE